MNILFFSILGACFGSFIPCFHERRCKHLSHFTRSQCTYCHHSIQNRFLIPIFGYFFTKGQCSYCHTPIPIYFPIFEGIGAISGFFFSYYSPSFIHSLLQLLIISFFLLISLDDKNEHLIYDQDLIILTIIELIDLIFYTPSPWFDHFIGALIVSIPLLILYRICPYSLGSGDILFMMITGFYLGYLYISYAFLIGIVVALLFSVRMLVKNKASLKTAIPLIPFLSFGVYITMLIAIAIN